MNISASPSHMRPALERSISETDVMTPFVVLRSLHLGSCKGAKTLAQLPENGAYVPVSDAGLPIGFFIGDSQGFVHSHRQRAAYGQVLTTLVFVEKDDDRTFRPQGTGTGCTPMELADQVPERHKPAHTFCRFEWLPASPVDRQEAAGPRIVLGRTDSGDCQCDAKKNMRPSARHLAYPLFYRPAQSRKAGRSWSTASLDSHGIDAVGIQSRLGGQSRLERL